MSPQSGARLSTDRAPKEDEYQYRGTYRYQNYENSRQRNQEHSEHANGFEQTEVPRQRNGNSAGSTHQVSNGTTLPPNVDAQNSRDNNQPQTLPARERSRTNGAPGGKSGGPRVCKKCDQPLTGQFVRALGGTYHLECFLCRVRSIYTPSFHI